jgi:hypothetical protein
LKLIAKLNDSLDVEKSSNFRDVIEAFRIKLLHDEILKISKSFWRTLDIQEA